MNILFSFLPQEVTVFTQKLHLILQKTSTDLLHVRTSSTPPSPPSLTVILLSQQVFVNSSLSFILQISNNKNGPNQVGFQQHGECPLFGKRKKDAEIFDLLLVLSPTADCSYVFVLLLMCWQNIFLTN